MSGILGWGDCDRQELTCFPLPGSRSERLGLRPRPSLSKDWHRGFGKQQMRAGGSRGSATRAWHQEQSRHQTIPPRRRPQKKGYRGPRLTVEEQASGSRTVGDRGLNLGPSSAPKLFPKPLPTCGPGFLSRLASPSRVVRSTQYSVCFQMDKFWKQFRLSGPMLVCECIGGGGAS